MDDDRAVTIADDELLTSVEKLDQALEQLANADAGPGNAMMLSMAKGLIPLARSSGYIPDNAEDLDATLLGCARWCLGMRSDAAWQPDSMDDLFMGPEPEPATDGTAEDQA